VKGLIFNLLDSMARQSGCADEAWDLVMEFVASEAEQDPQSDTCLSCFDENESLLSFEAPADAMIQCLGSELSGGGESLSEFPDFAAAAEAEEWIVDSIPALVDPDLCTSQLSMPSPEGFSHDLLSLLEQLLAEALTGEGEEADAEEYLPLEDLRRTTS
jgi:hypothetical protein